MYTLSLRNRGPAIATGLMVTDTLPPGLILVWTQPAQPLCGRKGRFVTCDAGELSDGDAITVTLDLSVGAVDVLGPSARLAGVSSSLSRPACAVDRRTAGSVIACSLDSLRAGAGTHVSVGVSADARAGGTFVHRALVTANEPDTDFSNNGATITATVAAEGPDTREPAAGIADPGPIDLSLEAGGPVRVIAGQPFTYTYTIANVGAVAADGVQFESVVPPAAILNAYEPASPPCDQRDDALVCTLHDPGSGETITFTLAITGHAGLAMELGLDPLMPGWPICTLLKERPWLHIVVCELGTLQPGQVAHVQLVLVATGVNERMMTNRASIDTSEGDVNPLDNTYTSTIAVEVRPDLMLWSSDPAPMMDGEVLSYTLTALNLGPSDADVMLTDSLPAGVRVVLSASSRGDDCRTEREEGAGDTVVCNLGRMSRGETVAVNVVIALDGQPTAMEEMFHSATVSVEQYDPNLANNELRQTIPPGASKGGARPP